MNSQQSPGTTVSSAGFPDFSWSHSRDQLLIQCARRYYWRYYAGWGGWHWGADPDARTAYTLTQLTELPLVLGSSLHACARDCVEAIRGGHARPTSAEMLARVRYALNRVCLGSANVAAFFADPKRHPMLRGVYYDGRLDPEEVARIADRMRSCLEHLQDRALWAEMEACAPKRIFAPDAMRTFQHGHTTVYAAPDAVYRPADDRVVIVDWKTGASSDAGPQLALYALYVREAFHLPFADGEWVGRTVNLATGEDREHEIGSIDLARAAARIGRSVAVMRGYLADPVHNIPLGRASFPLIEEERRSECVRCPYLQLCSPELEDAARPASDPIPEA